MPNTDPCRFSVRCSINCEVAPPLRCDTLDQKRPTLCGSLPNRSYRRIRGRVVPRVRLFRTIECKHYNSFRRRAAIQTLRFSPPNNKVIVTIEWRQCFDDLPSIFLYSSRIRDLICLRNQIDRPRFYLLSVNCITASCCHQSSGGDTHKKFEPRFHVRPPDFFKMARLL